MDRKTSSADESIERETLEMLSQLPPELRAAFAASCAERLFPGYDRYATRTGYGNSTLITNALDALWNHLAGAELSPEATRNLIDQCMAASPEQEGWPWAEETPRASDAVVAIIYALEAHLSENCQAAVWAARRVFDSLDEHIVDMMNIDVAAPGASSTIREHPLYQKEVERQRRVLDDLLKIASTPERIAPFMRELRDRSQKESLHIFQDMN